MFKALNKNPILFTDGYKLCHKDQYPVHTSWIYETWTPRMSRMEGVNHVVFFGLQGAMAEMVASFKEGFFAKPEAEVLRDYEEAIQEVFALSNPAFAKNHSSTHIRDLHRLGYLPLKIKALKEGSLVPIGVPMFTIENTLPAYFWLPGYLETQLSAYIWSPMTAATISNLYYRILAGFAEQSGDVAKVFTQAGDFSMRGMSSPESAYRTAAGHLLSFGVSATIAVRDYLTTYYAAKADVLRYTPSTEHSVMCSYGEDEYHAFHTLVTQIYPSGNVSIVSDTYDLWQVVDAVLPALKETIMLREGKVSIRPDSGDPVLILCGDPNAEDPTVRAGLVHRLYEIFGGTVNAKGFRELDPHIGVVYGDSITPARAEQICRRLMEKGYASSNAILGIGSYTYQYVTRDTFGFALKGTAEVVDGQFKAIQKRPATDTGNFKKSQCGMVAVRFEKEEFLLVDRLDPSSVAALEQENCLEDFFIDETFVRIQSFEEIKQLLQTETHRVYGKSI